MRKYKYLIVLLIIITIIGSVVFLLWQKPKSDRFEGTLKEIKDNTILVQGGYPTENEKRKELIILDIKIDQFTRIIKNSFVFPKTKGMVKMDELPKKESQVDLETLKDDFQRTAVGIFIELKNNIFNRNKPEAKEIKYFVPEF